MAGFATLLAELIFTAEGVTDEALDGVAEEADTSTLPVKLLGRAE